MTNFQGDLGAFFIVQNSDTPFKTWIMSPVTRRLRTHAKRFILWPMTLTRIVLSIALGPLMIGFAVGTTGCGGSTGSKSVKSVDVSTILDERFAGVFTSPQNEELELHISPASAPNVTRNLSMRKAISVSGEIVFGSSANQAWVTFEVPGASRGTEMIAHPDYVNLGSPQRIDFQVRCTKELKAEIKSLHYMPAIDPRKNAYDYSSALLSQAFPAARYFLTTTYPEQKLARVDYASPSHAEVLGKLAKLIGPELKVETQQICQQDKTEHQLERNSSYGDFYLPLDYIEPANLKRASKKLSLSDREQQKIQEEGQVFSRK